MVTTLREKKKHPELSGNYYIVDVRTQSPFQFKDDQNIYTYNEWYSYDDKLNHTYIELPESTVINLYDGDLPIDEITGLPIPVEDQIFYKNRYYSFSNLEKRFFKDRNDKYKYVKNHKPKGNKYVYSCQILVDPITRLDFTDEIKELFPPTHYSKRNKDPNVELPSTINTIFLASTSSVGNTSELKLKNLEIQNCRLIEHSCLENPYLENLTIEDSDVRTHINLSSSLKNLKWSGGLINDVSSLKNCLNLEKLYLNTMWLHNLDELDFSKFDKLSELKLLTITSLKPYQTENIFNAKNITKLEFNGPFNGISKLDKLKELTISEMKGDEIEGDEIEDFTEEDDDPFEEITKYKSFEEVRECKSLVKLIVKKTYNFKNIDFLQSLVNLEYLDLSDTSISSIDVISNFKKLEHLNLSNTKVKSLEALSELKNLKHLDLNGCKNIKNVTPILGITSLKEVLFLNVNLQQH